MRQVIGDVCEQGEGDPIEQSMGLAPDHRLAALLESLL
jgi:hypothetical protein